MGVKRGVSEHGSELRGVRSPDILEPHDCQKCRLSFSSVEEHRKHLQDSHPRDFHKCPVCHKVFHSAALLEKHKGMHSGVKPYSCDLCQKSYQVGNDRTPTEALIGGQMCGRERMVTGRVLVRSPRVWRCP